MHTDRSAPTRVILRDAAGGRWLRFTRPRRFVQTATLAEVAAALGRVDEAVAREDLYAAGFVSYEAAPAFDGTLVVNDDGEFPLLWFGLYESVEEVELPGLAAQPDADGMNWQASVGQAEFHREMARIKALIRSGDTYQVNYTYRLRTQLVGDPWSVFLQLVAAQDPPYGAFVDTGEWVICSASPELFFRLDGTRIESRPMKGTAARGRTQAEDLAQARTLAASEKERAENVMIVDMVRNDLGRVAQTGSVKVARLFEVERYPTLWQMTSTIEARTEAGLGEIFRALFPPASITGAPKVRTMQIIAELERVPRRVYTGTIGFLAPGRRAQFNVAIRTLLANRRTGCAEYGVGSGVTWGSDPEAEWQECRTKTRVLSAPVRAFSLLETMLWTPEAGFFLLERHLARLQESARYFGFRIDLAALRLELERLSAQLGRAAGVRPSAGAAGFDAPSTLGDSQNPLHADVAAPEDGRTPVWPVSTRLRIRLLVTKEGRFSLESEVMPEAAATPQRVALARAPVDSSDPFLYHKTTNRSVYEKARAACPGFDDVLLFNERGELTESTIANVAVDIDGKLCTPPESSGLLPGTLRADLLQKGELVERPIAVEELLRSRRVFLLNSARGRYGVEVINAEP